MAHYIKGLAAKPDILSLALVERNDSCKLSSDFCYIDIYAYEHMYTHTRA